MTRLLHYTYETQRENTHPAWSPDGSKIAFVSYRDGDAEIYVMNADGSNQTQLTNNTRSDKSPAWSPDGARIAFTSNIGTWQIFMMNADGSNLAQFTDPDILWGDKIHPTWAQGNWIAPTAITENATDKTSSSAKLCGQITSLGSAASVWVSFQWGASSDDYTSGTAPVSTNATGAFSIDLIGLSPGTTYYFRAKAVGDGTSYGGEKTFTTKTPPRVTTNDADGITSASARLNGNLDSLGTASTANVSFQWGISSENYTSETSPPVSMNATGPFSFALSDLNPSTNYYFRNKADGGLDGTSYGDEKSFKTEEIVTFPDPNLEAAIREAIAKPTGDLYLSDVSPLSYLYAEQRNIHELAGLEFCINLQTLYFSFNQITDISALTNLINLQVLYIQGNQITNISPLTNLTKLQTLWLGNNRISDTSPLSGLINLQELSLYANQISNISPLVANTGLSSGDSVDLTGNSLSADSLNIYIPQLQVRGVVVYYDANQPPDTPSDVSPADAATEVSLTPTLESSVFSDPDAVDIQAASQWQITVVPGDYSSPVFDSGTDSSNLTSITIPTGILEYAITYYWHVRHQDSRGAWSEWSAETSFTTEPEPVLLGDADGDGVISALDITSVERIIARLDSPTAGADANQDGKINALDITKIERLIAGLG